MSARQTKEWVGKTADTKIPTRVRDRILQRAEGRCESCGGPLLGQKVEIDHMVALINWMADDEKPHGNRESNLWAIGKKCCHIEKTKEDVAEKSKVYRKRTKMSGAAQPKGRGFPKPAKKSSKLQWDWRLKT